MTTASIESQGFRYKTKEFLRNNPQVVYFAIGMLVLATAGCSKEENPSANPEITATSTPNNVEPASEEVDSNTIDVQPMSEEDINFTSNVIEAGDRDKKDIEYRLNGRFGSYYPEVVAAACVTEFQAKLNYEHLLYAREQYESVKKEDPAFFNEYFANSAYYNELVRLENPAKALLANAVSDTECPAGNNSEVISFEHNGETLETNGDQLLYWIGGTKDAYVGDRSIEKLAGGYDGIIESYNKSIADLKYNAKFNAFDIGDAANGRIAANLTEARKQVFIEYYS
jgi:hypothetical protein